MSPDRIYMRDIRTTLMCAYGARMFFQRHQLNWSQFLREGIELSKIEATNDAMAMKVVEFVRSGRQ